MTTILSTFINNRNLLLQVSLFQVQVQYANLMNQGLPTIAYEVVKGKFILIKALLG